MNRLLIKKSINESALLFLACATMLFVFCWMRVWIVCQFDLQKFEPLLEQFRMFEKFMPVPLEQLLTYSGAIGMTFNEPVLILCIVVWSIARGSDVVSGELNRGTMEMLLSRPIGRTRLLVTHFFVCVLGLVFLCLSAWLGLFAGIETNTINKTFRNTAQIKIPFLPIEFPLQLGEATDARVPLSETVSSIEYIPTSINLFAFGFLILCLSMILSAVDRYRWRTIGLVLSIYVIQLLMFLLSKTGETWRWLEHWTLFAYYQPDAIVNFASKHPDSTWTVLTPSADQSAQWPYVLGPLGLSMALILIGCVLMSAAIILFRRRDLPAPL